MVLGCCVIDKEGSLGGEGPRGGLGLNYVVVFVTLVPLFCKLCLCVRRSRTGSGSGGGALRPVITMGGPRETVCGSLPRPVNGGARTSLGGSSGTSVPRGRGVPATRRLRVPMVATPEGKRVVHRAKCAMSCGRGLQLPG